ncbi:Uncharacterised protein [Pseudomonas aeruginosa]|nr:Uncharacterised protein [Pseudomonas aeruginosa]
MVKMIRELKQKIEEKLKELQEAMGSSDPDVRQNRLPALQKELQPAQLGPADGHRRAGQGQSRKWASAIRR